MVDLFADPPWYLPVLVALFAIVLLFQGNARQNARLKYVGVALAALAVVIIALGYFLESDREAVVRETREIIAAVNNRNWKDFSAHLDPEVRFFRLRRPRRVDPGGRKISGGDERPQHFAWRV